MKNVKFLLGILFGVIAAPVVYFAAVWLTLGAPLSTTYGPGVFIDTKREIAQRIDRPKILFVGGSSVAMGINAKQVQETTGIPAVNMGYWANLGPEYVLDQAKRSAKPGDLVVLVLEYGIYDWDGDCVYWADRNFLPIVFSRDVTFVRTRSLDEQFHFAIRLEGDYFVDSLKAKLHLDAPPPAGAGDFYATHDAWGDDLFNTPANLPATPVTGQTPHDAIYQLCHALPPDARAFPCITAFVRWAQGAGVKVVATFPNVAYNAAYERPEAKKTEEVITQFYTSLQVPVVGKARYFMFPPPLFFDTQYHLLNDAVHVRTGQLIPLLAPYLPAKSR